VAHVVLAVAVQTETPVKQAVHVLVVERENPEAHTEQAVDVQVVQFAEQAVQTGGVAEEA
jgi:hypothetical protein